MAGLPSECIEPLLADLLTWYLRDYAASEQTGADGARLDAASECILRIAILNNRYGVNGVHANIAASNAMRHVHRMLRMPPGERRLFLSDLISINDRTLNASKVLHD